mgnify:CR=1 FL=1
MCGHIDHYKSGFGATLELTEHVLDTVTLAIENSVMVMRNSVFRLVFDGMHATVPFVRSELA